MNRHTDLNAAPEEAVPILSEMIRSERSEDLNDENVFADALWAPRNNQDLWLTAPSGHV
jgi:hypothetical protein